MTFHFAEPDPEFLYQLTEFAFSAPIPPGTPDREPGQRTVPGTGPYKIVQQPRRDPVRAQPVLPRVVPRRPTGRQPQRDRVAKRPEPAGRRDRGRAGTRRLARGLTALRPVPTAQLQDPGQLHNNPQWAVAFLPLNTHIPPFNDLRVRQALNYAINRAKLVQFYGGPAFATPSCQAIVPGIPGYRRYCPYTLHPLANGAWSAPDMARARQLVAQSRTIGERIDLSAPLTRTPPQQQRDTSPAPARARLPRPCQRDSDASITPAMWNSFQIPDAGNWIPAYPDPSSYVPAFFSCGGSNGNDYYCNPAIDREMRHAELLELTDPPAADALWES